MQLDKKQQKLLLFGAIAFVLVFFILARLQGAKQPAPTITAAAPASNFDLSPLTGYLQSVAAGLADSQTAIASISQNQVVQSAIDLTKLGAESWLSCLPAGGGRPDAACIKAKGGVVVPGAQAVSDVKTQQILDAKYTGPYAECKRSDGSYDLQCVGWLIAGKPSLNVATKNT